MAKRYKAEHHAGSNGRTGRPPIPSFNSPAAAIPERMTTNHGNNNNSNSSSNHHHHQQQQPLLPKPWTKRDEAALVRLVTAMEVHARHHGSNGSSTDSSSSSTTLLSLDEFYALVRKTSSSSAAAAAAATAAHTISQQLDDNDHDKKGLAALEDYDPQLTNADDTSSFNIGISSKTQQHQQEHSTTPKLPPDITTEGEKLLYLLLCATGSVLYDLRQVPATSNSTTTLHHDKKIGSFETQSESQSKQKTSWYLQTLPCPKRVEKLRHLLLVSETSNTASTRIGRILAAIREHRAMVEASKKKNNNKTQKNKTASSISTSLMIKKKQAPPPPPPPQHSTKDDDDDDDKSRFLAALDSPQKHIIRPGMTIEERVRVRQAQVEERKRLEQQEQQEAAAAASGNHKANSTQDQQQGEWLLSLADVLFFRARDIWQRQERCFQKSSLLRPSRQDFVRPAAGRHRPLFGSSSTQDDQNNNNNKNPSFQASPCIMTLRDVLLVLSKSATTTTVPASLSSTRDGKKLTRRRIIVRAVQELSRRLPEWIQFTLQQQQQQQQKGEGGKRGLDPDATTVWIKPGVSYTTIQTTLLVPGSRKSNNKAMAAENAAYPPTNNISNNVVTQPSATSQQQQHQQQNQKRFKVTSRKRPPPLRIAPGVSKSLFGSDEPSLLASPKKSRTLASLVASVARTANHETSSTDRSSSFAAAVATTTPSTTTPNGKRKMTLPPLVHSTNSGVADGATTSTTSTTHHHHAPTSPSTLRINPHLILTDADYSGGECLLGHKNARNNSSSSPRGLKSLFTQLNSGQRI